MKRFFVIALTLTLGMAVGVVSAQDTQKKKAKSAEQAERDRLIDDFFNRTEGNSRGQRGQRRGGGRRGGPDGSLIVGEMAPTFVLKSLDGKTETDLSAFAGKKPVILFYGSYT